MFFFLEPPVQIIGNSGHPEHHILVAGDDLILECEVSRPNATVQWLWNGEILKPDTRIKIDSYDVVRKLVLSGLQPSDSGKYICDAVDDKLITIVEVQGKITRIVEQYDEHTSVCRLWATSSKSIVFPEPPAKFVNKNEDNNISAYENESVTLCAFVSQERANVRWLKDGQLLNADNIHISSEGNTHKLTINPLQLSDSGEYVCDVNTDEMYFSLLVKGKNLALFKVWPLIQMLLLPQSENLSYLLFLFPSAMRVKFIKQLENVVSLKGSKLTLQCEINKPKGDVQWLKDGQEVPPSRRHTIRAQGRERSFTIHQVTEEDTGEYLCESTDDRTSATVTVESKSI